MMIYPTSLTRLAGSEWVVMWRRPWPWIALGLLLLFTQAYFWLGVAWDDAFNAGHLASVLSIVVDGVTYFLPIFAIVLMGCIQRTGWGHCFVAKLLSTRILAVILALTSFAVAAFVALVPGALIVESLSPTSEPGSSFSDSWIPLLELLGRALLLAIPYALLCALLTLLTRSRMAGALLCIAYALAERILFDLTLGRFELTDWIRGLLLVEVYYFWLGDPNTTLGFMTNVFGLEDGLQGLLVIGFHTSWMSAAVCLLVVGGRRLRDERAGVTAPPSAGVDPGSVCASGD